MRVVFALFLTLVFAATAFAAVPSHLFSKDRVGNLPTTRDAVYCQQPSVYWQIYNAENAFGGEEADDVPATGVIDEVQFYVGEWASSDYQWHPFTSLIAEIYDASCPPGQTPSIAATVAYADLNATNVYGDGFLYVDQVTACLGAEVTLTGHQSVGGIMNVTWGQGTPYGGLAVQYNQPYAGCGDTYWSFTAYGIPKWVDSGSYFGMYNDMVYCVNEDANHCLTPVQSTSWGQIKSLYNK